MKHVFCRFYRTKEVDITAWENIIGKLRLDFMLLCQGQIDPREAAQYVSQLCYCAEPLENDPRMAFLGMAKPDTMPSDARVEYFYMPTYYAAAFMAKTALLNPDLLYGEPWYGNEMGKEDLRKVIASCLLGCTGRGFQGHGFDGQRGLVETMEIFADADMNTFVDRYPDFCPEFTKMYKDTLSYIKARVSEGRLAGEWGDDYTEQGRSILEKNGITC